RAPFEDLGTESPESPHVVSSPISFPDSTPPVGHVEESEGSDTSGAGSTSLDSTTPLSPDHSLTRDTPVLVPSLRRTARMVVRVRSVLSPGYFARIGEATSMSDVAFHKRFRTCYESSPSPSPTFPVQKRYKGTYELVLSTNSKGDELEDEEDEEVSLDSDSGSEDTEDEGLAAGDEDPSMRDEGFGLGEDEAVPEGQQQAAPVVETTVEEPLGLVATPTATIPVDEDQFIERYRLRSLEQEQERAVMTFRALWRPVLALETWAGHVDTRMENMSRAGYDNHRLVHDLLVHQTSLQHELQEMRGRITALEQERDRREQ
ncbi:hypothetical protein Tco_1396143, partial [Tanacetum coccineum]